MRESEVRKLPQILKQITEAKIMEYANVSGDTNPLHLDESFAETTDFGARIAHGMLTLSFISEMMIAEFGIAWIATGSLRVRFKGPAYIGDKIATIGEITSQTEADGHNLIECSVGIINQNTNEPIITGIAKVQVNISE
jgi:3-hydroxybutyryl-CoA dehydratase